LANYVLRIFDAAVDFAQGCMLAMLAVAGAVNVEADGVHDGATRMAAARVGECLLELVESTPLQFRGW
jgi:hypothetical protein